MNGPLGRRLEPRPIVKGRYSHLWLYAAACAALVMPLVFESTKAPELLRAWMDANLCVAGPFGMSRSMFYVITVFGTGAWLVIASVFTGFAFDGWQMWKHERHPAAGSQPWFDTELVEGRQARRRGVKVMTFCAGCLTFLVRGAFAGPLREFNAMFVKPPAELSVCKERA